MNNTPIINIFNDIAEKSIVCLLDIDDFTTFNILNSYEKGNSIIYQMPVFIKRIPTIHKLVRIDSDEFIFSCFGSFESNKKYLFTLMQSVQNEMNVTVSIAVTENDIFTYSYEYTLNKLKEGVITAKCYGKNKLYFR